MVKYVRSSVYVLHHSEGSEDTCTQVSLKCLLAIINLVVFVCFVFVFVFLSLLRKTPEV